MKILFFLLLVTLLLDCGLCDPLNDQYADSDSEFQGFKDQWPFLNIYDYSDMVGEDYKDEDELDDTVVEGFDDHWSLFEKYDNSDFMVVEDYKDDEDELDDTVVIGFDGHSFCGTHDHSDMVFEDYEDELDDTPQNTLQYEDYAYIEPDKLTPVLEISKPQSSESDENYVSDHVGSDEEFRRLTLDEIYKDYEDLFGVSPNTDNMNNIGLMWNDSPSYDFDTNDNKPDEPDEDFLKRTLIPNDKIELEKAEFPLGYPNLEHVPSFFDPETARGIEVLSVSKDSIIMQIPRDTSFHRSKIFFDNLDYSDLPSDIFGARSQPPRLAWLLPGVFIMGCSFVMLYVACRFKKHNKKSSEADYKVMVQEV